MSKHTKELREHIERCNIYLRILMYELLQGDCDKTNAVIRLEDMVRLNEEAIAKAEGKP